MATEIKQIDDLENGVIFLLVSGEMMRADAKLVERIAIDLREEKQVSVVIDLADLDFLDSEAAPILKRIADREGYTIEGIEVFVQSTIDQAERQS